MRATSRLRRPRGVVALLGALAASTALWGCASIAGPPPSAAPVATPEKSAPSSAPAASLTPPPGPTARIPTPGPTPSAISYGAASLTRGVLDCRFVGGATVCDARANDPRVSGTLTETVEVASWGTDPMHGVEVWSGPARLVNAKGTWTGTFSGMFASGLGPVLTYWYTGTGGYAGLSYFAEVRAAEDGGGWSTTGVVFPGAPPAH